MPVIDPHGLFEGERLAACSQDARLYWVYYMCASNRMGRIEINYQKILAEAFCAFPSPPTEAEFLAHLKEYADNHLLFIYKYRGHLWGQWDAKSWTFGTKPSAADKRSPAPPEKEFQQWLDDYKNTSQHESARAEIVITAPSPEDLRKADVIDAIKERESPVNVTAGIGVGNRNKELGIRNKGEERPLLVKQSRPETLDEDFPSITFAQKVAAEVCLTEPGIVSAIGGAIDFCVKFEGKTKNTATDYLIHLARDEIQRGGTVNRFWFSDRKWRPQANGKGSKKASLDVYD